MNREEMELASASTSSAAPAVKHRGRVAALIAAVIVAAALLFTMPSLAHAAEEPLANQPVSTAQEIPLSNVDSGTSVSKTPSKADTSPTYSQTDAYKASDTASEVVLSNGTNASKDSSYQAGDDKSSAKDDDSDSDASANGTENKGDSTINNGGALTNSNSGNDSTGDSTGATSNSSDVISTDNNQSEDLTAGSNANDVIATPGTNVGQGSADLAVSGTSATVEGVQSNQVTNNSSSIVTSGDITTQGTANLPITIRFDLTMTTEDYEATYKAGANATSPYDLFITPDSITGKEPIFLADGTYFGRANQAVTIAGGAALSTSTVVTGGNGATTALSNIAIGTSTKMKRYGYTVSKFYLFGHLSTGNWQCILVSSAWTGTSVANQVKSTKFDEWIAVPVWSNPSGITVEYDETKAATKLTSQTVYYADTIPYLDITTYSAKFTGTVPDPYVFYDLSFLSKNATTNEYTIVGDGAVAIGEGGMKLYDYLDKVYHIFTSTENYNSSYVTSLKLIPVQVPDDFKMTVNYNNYNGSANKPVEYTSKLAVATVDGLVTGAAIETSRSGYKFDGWALTTAPTVKVIDSKGKIADAFTLEKDGVYTLVAIWTPIYTVTFNPNGATGSAVHASGTLSGSNMVVSVESGKNTTAATVGSMAKTGYNFKGWATTAGATAATLAAGAAINNVTSNLTYYAVWEAGSLTITYNTNKPSGATANPSITSSSDTATYGSNYTIKTTAAYTPSLTGYKFLGWGPATGSTEAQKITSLQTVTSDQTIYAIWGKNPSITYNANTPTGAKTTVSGMPTSPQSVTYGDNATIPATAPTLTGYTFAGWAEGSATSATVRAAGYTYNALNADKALYAKWTAKNNYSVVYKSTAPGTTTETTVNTLSNLTWDSGNVTLQAAPTAPTGYTFGGWFYQKDTNSNGTGTQYSSATTFNNIWNTAKGITALGVTDSTTSITLYAKWNPKGKVHLYLNPNGGQYAGSTATYTAGEVLEGQSASIPAAATKADPTRTGYTFAGWADSNTATTGAYSAGQSFTLTADKTVYAVWTPLEYTLTYDGNRTGASGVPAADTLKHGIAKTISSATPTLTGYAFNGWATSAANANAGTVAYAKGATIPAASVTGNITLYAVWGAYTYTIAWNKNDGTTGAAANVKTDTNQNATSVLTKPATDPQRAGYTFKGWTSTSASSTTQNITSGTTTVAGAWNLNGVSSGSTLTAYAIWEENKVQIRFYGDANAAPKYSDGTAYTAGTTLWVGAATGTIYATQNATTGTGKTFSASLGMMPNITNTNYEFSAANGSKWTISSATGTTKGTASTFIVPREGTGNTYASADYYLTVSPKRYDYTIEYWLQDVTGPGYTEVTSMKTTNNKAGFGFKVQQGASASAGTDANKTATYVLGSITGATYNSAKSTPEISSMAASGNVIKLYFDRNEFDVTVTYVGSVPDGYVSPGTTSYRYGAPVTLSKPSAPTGYNAPGAWTLVETSISGMNSAQYATFKNGVINGSFAMPNQSINITLSWSKEGYDVYFVSANTGWGTLSANGQGTLDQNIPFGDPVKGVPTATPTNSDAYYFMGWQLWEGVNAKTTNNSATYYNQSVHGGTLKGLFSTDQIMAANGSADTPHPITTRTLFLAIWGEVRVVNYVSGTNGGFTTKNGAVNETTRLVQTVGTRYTNLYENDPLPRFGGVTFVSEGNNIRNAGNPQGKDGYKFKGWSWTDLGDGSQHVSYGYYAKDPGATEPTYHLTGGEAMPTKVTRSFTFEAIWEECTIQLVYSSACANISGVSATGMPTNVTAKMAENVTLPTGTTVKASGAPTGYKLLGWTTSASGSTPLYTSDFTMTSGAQNTTLYPLGECGYGITLYPVFEELTVTIKYALANGSTGMGSVDVATEGSTFKMATGSAVGSTATATNAGYSFKGWFKDAAHTLQITDSTWISGNKITPQKVNGVYEAATYYAWFEVNKFDNIFQVSDGTVTGTWTTGGGSADQTKNLAYNTKYSTNVPAVTAPTGYTFQGWKDTADNKVYAAATLQNMNVPYTNKTYVAVFAEKTNYTVKYNTNGGSTVVDKGSSWTQAVDVTPAPTRQGFKFKGWFYQNSADNNGTGAECVAGTAFNDALTNQGGTVAADGTAVVTLYAQWEEREITLHFEPKYPENKSTNQTFVDQKVKWSDAVKLIDASGASAATLSLAGYDFVKWSTTAAASGTTVTSTSKVNTLYQGLYGTTDNTKTTINLYGIWDLKTFTVVFQNGSTTLQTLPNQTWNDTITYLDYTVTDGSKTLVGWKYTPAGGSEQTWVKTDGNLPVSAFDGTPTPAAGSTFYLKADLVDNTKWVINFNKVGIDGTGAVNMSSENKISSVNGFATPGVAIDITNFNAQNYIDNFENQNGAGRRTDLKGYELKVIPATKTMATAAEVAAGGTVTFNVYWVEKAYTITYDLGESTIGAKPYAGSDPAPADKTNVGWTSSNILPTTNPTWDGYKAPVWKYRNAAGQWVAASGKKVSDIATSDAVTSIVLKAFWDTDKVRLTYAAQTGGSAAGGSITVNAGGSKYEDIDAVNGIPTTMTATAASGYTFTGWYKDNELVTTDAALTAVKGDDGLFATALYEARFRQLGAFTYTVQYFMQGLDGQYAHDGSKDTTHNGQEGQAVSVTNDMKKTYTGFTYAPGMTGSVESISHLADGDVLKLFYTRNAYKVEVFDFKSGADHPDVIPAITYPTTGLTQASSNKLFGESLALPTMPDVAGWGFTWSYEPASGTASTMGNADPFTMPASNVNIYGVWSRVAHNVNFEVGTGDDGQVHGSVTATGATLPFTVDHGKKLTDASSTGTYRNNIHVVEDATWALTGWKIIVDGADAGTTLDPDSIEIVGNTIFRGIWAQTYYVIYSPDALANGNHGGAGFTTQIKTGNDIKAHEAKNVNEFKLNIPGQQPNYAPAASGYSFIGWTWNMNGTDHYWLAPDAPAYVTGTLAGTQETDINFTVTANVVFRAIWQANEQELAFKLDNKNPSSNWTATGAAAGTTGSLYTVNPKPRTDQLVSLLGATDITRDGYKLKGWAVWTDKNGDGIVTDNELGDEYPLGNFKMPDHAVTFAPLWDFVGIAVNYAIGNGSAGKGTLDVFTEPINDSTLRSLEGSTATPQKGYKVGGWFLDAACTKAVGADWLIYNADGSVQVAPVKTGIFADGWVPAILYAQFLPDAAYYTIEYYFQNVDGTHTLNSNLTGRFNDINAEDTADVTVAGNPAANHLLSGDAMNGYVFNPGQYGSVLTAVVAGDGSTVLKLFYDRIPFQITYDLGTNGANVGQWTGNAGPSEAIADSIVSIPGVKLEGMKHSGWKITWTDTDGNAHETTTGIGTDANFKMPAADVLATALYAKYIDIIIEYITDDGMTHETFKTEPVYNAGIEGTVWYLGQSTIDANRPAGFTNPTYECKIVLEDGDEAHRTLKVIYDIVCDYKINFNPNGGTGETETVTGLAITDKPASYATFAPTRAGYTLGAMPTRWNTKADGTGMWLDYTTSYKELAEYILGVGFNDAKLINDGLTVYAIWSERADFEVKFDLNNNPDTNPNISKYVPDYLESEIVADMTGVRWTQNGFNLKSDSTWNAAPHGYKFVGWNTKADGTGLKIGDATRYLEMSNAINSGVVQDSITLFAQWEEIIIKIEYLVQGGGKIDRVVDYVSAVTGQHVDTGSSAGTRLTSVATANPGWTFKGWQRHDSSDQSGMVTMADFLANKLNAWHVDGTTINVHEPADKYSRLFDETYIAIFEQNADTAIKYHVNADNGKGTIASTVKPYGTPNVSISDGSGFKLSHYTIAGWNTKEDGTGDWYDLGQKITMPQGGLDLYAVWDLNSYGVTVKGQDDKVANVKGANTTLEWGKPLSDQFISNLQVNPKTGSTFAGWHYKMTDADTGEIIEGIVHDLSELTVLGDVEIDALFDVEEPEEVVEPEAEPVPVDGTIPKTGDDVDFGWMFGLAFLLLAVARRRENEDEAAGAEAKVA